MPWEDKYRLCLVSANLLRENRLTKIIHVPAGKN